MSLGAVLNSDVASLRMSAARAFSWWLGELQDLLPKRPRARARRSILVWDEENLRLVGRDGRKGKMPGKGAAVCLALPEGLAFRRTLELPRMSAADLRRLVELEAERLSPLPPSEALIGMEAGRSSAGKEQSCVDIAVLPLVAAKQALEAARQAGLTVAGFSLLGASGEVAGFDFLPALRALGLIANRRSGALVWWSVAAFFFLLNIAVLVMRDRQSVDRLQAVVEQQEPALHAARTLEVRASDFEGIARSLVLERRAHDVLTALAIASQDLPAGAWVQRFTYAARTARLTGYKRKDLDVAAPFRKDPRIAAIRANTGQFVSDTPAGQPFDLIISLKAGR